MDEYEFCVHWCGPLTPQQRARVAEAVKDAKFLGVGRLCGSTVIRPMVARAGSPPPYVVMYDGSYAQAALDGRRLYLGGVKLGPEPEKSESATPPPTGETAWRLAGALAAADRRFAEPSAGGGPVSYANILLDEVRRWGLSVTVTA